ncbi:fimbria/pilus periplasmic chaperone [Pseudomonas sp. FP818]|uniref:fimbria/pilus periplasmic chaperone n=1 Tax=Pseudomonas sp. FP818 TaxID=2954099 RepID=UPI002732A61D|nr:fimbria/pilus periplasmic chaperone [Pseudomonas sp. FP818]WLI37163.1 fimbria/pilus periplasmic chaperone [Pseudomonas sp. FP818]
MDVFNAYKKKMVACVALWLSLVSTASFAGGVGLGATRVVYPADSKQVSLSVSNTDKNNVYLLQSWIDTAEGGVTQDFMVTPPLFVIKQATESAPAENTLRLVYAGPPLAQDRETLFWVNVKAIPSTKRDADDGQSKLRLAVVSRIKLFYRPKELANGLQDSASKVEVKRVGNTLAINNPTPYFISLIKVSVGEHVLDNTMVAPYGQGKVRVPENAKGELHYSFINDYGALIKLK